MSYNIRTTLDVQDNLNIGLNASISGSLTVTGSIYGNLNGTATSASYVLNAVSSSRAVSASFAQTASFALQVSTSISTQNLQHNVLFVDTSGPGVIQVDGGLRYNPNQDLLTTTSSYTLLANTASYVQNAQSASYVLQAVSSSYALTASFAPNYQLTSSTGSMLQPYVLNTSTSSFVTTSSFNSFTSSINNKTGSFATTGSNTFIGNQTITGSLLITGSSIIIGPNTISTTAVATFGNGVGSDTYQTNASNGSVELRFRNGTNPTTVTSGVMITNALNGNIVTNQTGSFGMLDMTSTKYQPTAGGAEFYGINLSNTINSQGSGSIKSIYYNPTITRITGSHRFIESTAGDVLIQSGSYPLFFITGSGQVGIGTITPSASLHISGSSNSALLKIDSPASSNILFVSGSGNVGIGTLTPSTKLHIKGTTSGSGTTAFRVENSSLSASLTVSDFGYVTTGGPLVIGNTALFPVNGTSTILTAYGYHAGQIELRPNNLSSLIYFSNGGSGGGMYLGVAKYFSTPYSVYASGSVIVGDYSGFTNNTAAPARFAVSGSNNQTLVNIESPGSSSIFNVSGSGVVTINGAIPVTRNATGYNVGRFTNSASFDNILVAISSSGNPVASSVSGSVNVFYSAISSVAGSAISSSVNTGAIFTTGSWSVLTSATLGSGGDTITSHIQDQDRGRLYRATFIQTAGPASGSVVIERLI
jgi:hypothetical protein